MRKLGVLVAALFGLALPVIGQTQEGSWSNLNELKAGQKIELVESSMKQHKGNFVTVTEELLTLKESSTEVSVKRENVARVSVSSGARRGEHALIGFLVGGAAGAGIGAAAGSNSKGAFVDTRGIGALIGLVIGAPSGAVVGAAVPGHRTLYRAASAARPH